MTQWADYSGGRPSGAALKAAGFSGAIRYIGLGSAGKRLAAGEYASLTAAGIQVLLVAEAGTTDAWNGYAAGVSNARAALNDARALGVPDSVGIAAAADAHAANQAQIDAAVQYARGFVDVLGKARTGFYGFSETLNAVHAAGVVGWYWRCGSEPTATEKTWVHFWQRNAAPVVRFVSGVQCDINEQYNPVGVTPAPTPTVNEEDEMEAIALPASPSTSLKTIPWNGRAGVLNVIATDTDVFVGRPLNWGPGGGTGGGDPTNPALPVAGNGWRVTANLPGAFTIPAGTTRIVYSWSCNTPSFIWPVAS